MFSLIARIFCRWSYETRVETLINEANLLEEDLTRAQDALVERLSKLNSVKMRLRQHFYN